jgi:hypothetical protein
MKMSYPDMIERWSRHRNMTQICLGPHELLWLIENSGKMAGSDTHEHGEHGRKETEPPVVLRIDDPDGLKADFATVRDSIEAIVHDMKNIDFYARAYGAALDGADKAKPVDCHKVMGSYEQCAAWGTEVLKNVAKMQCAIARLGAHAQFDYVCAPDPCAVPIPPNPTGGKGAAAKLAPQQKARPTAPNERQTVA